MFTVLLGEAPSRSSDPLRPFSGRSGARLAALAGFPLADRFELRNLLDAWPGAGGKGSRWDARSAHVRAAETPLDGRRVIFVGRRVATAYGHGNDPWMTWHDDGRGFVCAVIPHPSGIVRFWNDPASAAAVGAFLRASA